MWLLTKCSCCHSDVDVVNTAAAPLPKATSMAPVRVARSMIVLGLNN